MKDLRCVITVFLFISIHISTVNAATIDGAVSLKQMASDSDSILIGTPVYAENKVSSRGSLYTEVTLANVEALNEGGFRELGREYALYIWGGIRGEDGRPADRSTPPPHFIDYIQGTPRLSPNQSYLFFLSGNGVNALPFVLSDLGAYAIGNDGVLTATEGEQIVLDNRQDPESGYFVRKPANRESPPVLLVTATDADGVISVEPDTQNTTDVVAVNIEQVKKRISEIRRGVTDSIFDSTPVRKSEIFVNANGRR